MRRPTIITAVALALLAGCSTSPDPTATTGDGQANDGQQADSAPQDGDKPNPVPAGKKMCEVVAETDIEQAVGDEVTTFPIAGDVCEYSLAKLRVNIDIRPADGSESDGTKELRSLPEVSPGATLVV